MGDLLQLRDAHQQVQMLLPWHANGTLEPNERAFAEAHLADCAECRADLAAEGELRALYASAPLPDGASQPAVPRAVGGRSWRLLSSGWGRAASFAAAAAAAAAIVVLVVPRDTDGEYRLLGSGASSEVGNAIVLFSPDTPARDLRAALDQAGARLVDGPTASGAYIVHVPEERRSAALEGLRALPQVMLAEPVDAAAP